MSNTTNPNEPVKKVEGSVDDQDAASNNDPELASGMGTGVKSPGTPAAGEESKEEGKESRERLRTLLTVLAITVSCIALGVNWFSCNAAQQSATAAQESARNAKRSADAATTQVETAIDALHSQRPYVNLGKADGTVAEYLAPTKKGKKGTIILYFHNTGPAAAINFLTNAYSLLPPAEKGKQRHLYRARIFFKGKPSHMSVMSGATLGANSLRVEALNSKWIPTVNQWKQIASGQRETEFFVGGNFEYCDSWGAYHCEMFTIRYEPAPVNRFIVGASEECPNALVTLPDPSELARADDHDAILLPRCEQPEERKTREENSQ